MEDCTEAKVVAAINEAAKDAGIESLRQEQQRSVQSFVEGSGSDVFVALPTGYGKSMIYGMLPRVFDILRNTSKSTILVVSPLIGLMSDQVASFAARGIPAVHVSDKHKLDERVKEDIQGGKFRIVLISPEALFSGLEWKQVLCNVFYRSNLVAFVVDEAHCIKKW